MCRNNYPPGRKEKTINHAADVVRPPVRLLLPEGVIALYENATPFTFRMLDNSDPSTFSSSRRLKRFPLLLGLAKAVEHRQPRQSDRTPRTNWRRSVNIDNY
jgi:hypothetical protein